jgi:hypothetical protein
MTRRTINLRRKKRRNVRRTRGGLYFLGPNANKTDFQNEYDFDRYRDSKLKENHKKNVSLEYDCKFLYPGPHNFNREPISVDTLNRKPFDCRRTEIDKRWTSAHAQLHPKTYPNEHNANLTKEQSEAAFKAAQDERGLFYYPKGATSGYRYSFKESELKPQ